MKKGYILMDIQDKCKICRFYYPARDMHTGEYTSSCRIIPAMMIREPENKPDWCPIQELPERKKPKKFTLSPMIKEQYYEFDSGYNACLDYLEGE